VVLLSKVMRARFFEGVHETAEVCVRVHVQVLYVCAVTIAARILFSSFRAPNTDL